MPLSGNGERKSKKRSMMCHTLPTSVEETCCDVWNMQLDSLHLEDENIYMTKEEQDFLNSDAVRF